MVSSIRSAWDLASLPGTSDICRRPCRVLVPAHQPVFDGLDPALVVADEGFGEHVPVPVAAISLLIEARGGRVVTMETRRWHPACGWSILRTQMFNN